MGKRKKTNKVQNQKEEGVEEVEEKRQLSLREMCKVLDRSNVWVRRMVKEGEKFKSAVKVDGEWRVDESEVLEYLAVLEEREAKYEAKKKGEFKYPYSRPSQTSIRMIRKKVEEDDQIGQETKVAFLDALKKYESEYEEAYLEKKGQ